MVRPLAAIGRSVDADLDAIPPDVADRILAVFEELPDAPVAVVHGDTGAPNIRIDADGSVGLLDWDESRVDLSWHDLSKLGVQVLEDGDHRRAGRLSNAWEAANAWTSEPATPGGASSCSTKADAPGPRLTRPSPLGPWSGPGLALAYVDTEPAELSDDRAGRIAAVRTGARTAFRPLSNPNYRLYFSGQVVSLSGTWMQTAGLAWLVLHLTGSGTTLGLVTAAQFVPVLLGSAWGGLLADRLNKHRTLLVSQTGLGLTAAALATITLAGHVQIWMLVALSLLTGVFTTVDNPTRQSFVTEVVDRDHLATAVALNSVMFNSARIVGPALASVIIEAFGADVQRGTGVCFALNAVSYLAVIGCLARMNPAAFRRSEPVARSRGQIRAAVSYAMGEPALRTILLMMAVIGLLSFNNQVLLPLVAKNVFRGGAGTFGLLSVAMGAGALVGSLAAAGRGRASPRLITVGATLFGVAMLAAAAAPVLWLELVAWMVVGASMMTLMASASTTLQLATRPDMRGRVIALYMLLLMGSTPIGGPMMGWLAQHVGTRWAVAVGGLAAVVGGAISLRAPAEVASEPQAAAVTR